MFAITLVLSNYMFFKHFLVLYYFDFLISSLMFPINISKCLAIRVTRTISEKFMINFYWTG